VILTNTFGASGLRLEQQGFGEFVRDINVAGAQLAARARDGAGRPVYVAGSVGPAVTASQRRRVQAAHRVEALRVQIEALAQGGVDALVLETFGYLEELARNIVCEMGNPPLLGDYPNVDGVWDVDSVGLIELVVDLNQGH
jgi:homocysteine S-methyltransferase